MTPYMIALIVPIIVSLVLILLVQRNKAALRKSAAEKKGDMIVHTKSDPDGPVQLKGFTLEGDPSNLNGNLTINALSDYIRRMEEVICGLFENPSLAFDLTVGCTLFPDAPARFEFMVKGSKKALNEQDLLAALQAIDPLHGKLSPVSFQAFFVIRT